MRRVTGVLVHPRATMAEVVRHPAFITTWVVVLLAVAVCGGLLLSTPVGRQALVDERVRVTEAWAGASTTRRTPRLQANPPLSVYLTSGGRLLLTPPVTMLVAAGLVVLARVDGARPVVRDGAGDHRARDGGAGAAADRRDAACITCTSR